MKMIRTAAALGAVVIAGSAHAGLTVSYTQDLGGNNPNPLNGLAAEATWVLNGTTLEITLTNTSVGLPDGAEASDQLLTSIGFDLGNVTILSGDSADIAAGSVGLGMWSGLGGGDSVADSWAWTNKFGGDLLGLYPQVISTSQGQGGGTTTGFDGSDNPNLDGRWGGIAADPVLINIPDSQEAVSNAIVFTLTLSDTLTQDELSSIAHGAVVEFGSDYQYLGVPAPGTLALLGLGFFGTRRRRA